MDLTSIDRQEYYSGFANLALWLTHALSDRALATSRAPIMRVICGSTALSPAAIARLVRPDDLDLGPRLSPHPARGELRAIGIDQPDRLFPPHSLARAGSICEPLPEQHPAPRSITSYDLVGVHTERDADNLRPGPRAGGSAPPYCRATCSNSATARPDQRLSHRHRRERLPGPGAKAQPSLPLVRQTIAGLGSRKLIIGVDRLDYSKGIPERMDSFERFLGAATRTSGGRVTYLQIAPTSRSEVPEVRHPQPRRERYARADQRVARGAGLGAIHYVTSSYPRSVLAGLYRLAKVGLVTPMRDGMYLVSPRNMSALRIRLIPAVLVLSEIRRGCGAAHGRAHRQPERQIRGGGSHQYGSSHVVGRAREMLVRHATKTLKAQHVARLGVKLPQRIDSPRQLGTIALTSCGFRRITFRNIRGLLALLWRPFLRRSIFRHRLGKTDAIKPGLAVASLAGAGTLSVRCPLGAASAPAAGPGPSAGASIAC